ncbi:TIR domain-containing protein [Nocardia sp. NPDC004068]|uniref:TIR domain-containing protein n=1 Tax=Nocardia sp. NPDC004068 TaxID=3364303 RepID=UPI0036A4B153
MADVAISYSHADASAAAEVRSAVEAQGLSIWMDESGAALAAVETIHLPSGQKHWDVITSEFAGADVVLMVDTPNWRESPYCQDEYRFLRQWGKWIVHVTPGDPETYTSFASALREHRSTIRAHTRLVQAALASASAPAQSRVERLLNRSHVHDARRVLGISESREVSVSEELARFGRDVLERDRVIRAKLVRAGVTSTAVLAVLALIGVAAWAVAEVNRHSAVRNANRSIALGLASESRSAKNTVSAVDLAMRADALQSSRETTEAVAQARARDARMRVVDIDKNPYVGAVWAPGGQTLVAYTNDEIFWLDGESGRVRERREVSGDLAHSSVVVSADGRDVAFVGEDDSLWTITSDPGSRAELIGRDITAVATGDGTSLWWSLSENGSGRIVRGRFGAEKARGSDVYSGVAALALTVDDSRHSIDYVGVDGKVHSLLMDSGRAVETESFDVGAVDLVNGRYGAAITRCGDNLFGILYGGTGLEYNIGYKAKSFNSLHGVIEVLEGRSNGRTPPVCQPDGTAMQGNILGSAPPDSARAGGARPDIPKGAEDYVLAADPGGTRLAILTWQGQLYLPRGRHIASWPLENAVALLPLQRDLALLNDGTILEVATKSVVGHVDLSSIYAGTMSVVGDAAYILTGEGVFAVWADGHAENVLPIDPATVTDLRAGSDRKHLIVVENEAVVLFDVASRATTRIPVGGLHAGDLVDDADITPAGDSVVLVTANGQVAALEVAAPNTPKFGPVLASGLSSRIAVSPTVGRVVVAGQDGVLRIFDQNLIQVGEAYAGRSAGRMTVAGDYVLLTFDPSAAVYDVSEMRMIDVLDGPLDPETARIDLSSKEIRGLMSNAFVSSQIGKPAAMRRVEIPLPGLR